MSRLCHSFVLITVGCGRLGFSGGSSVDGSVVPDGPARDIASCALIHDEDGDGLDDACDPCPHLAEQTDDSDGDGVGDACDPQPALAKQRIAFFDTFETTRLEWGGLSNMTIGQDQMRASAMSPATAYANVAIANGELEIVTGGVINAVFTSTPHSIAISFGFNNGGANYHYVQFYDNGSGTGMISIAKAEGGSYPSIASTPYAGDLPTGAWRMKIDESVAVQSIALVSGLGDQSYMPLVAATSSPTALTTATGIAFLVRNADVTVDYLLAIETLP